MTKSTKRQRAINEVVDFDKTYLPLQALETLKKVSGVKFNETLEVILRLGVDPRHADQQVRGSVQMPNGTGKNVRVAVFAPANIAEKAKKAGADIVGAEEFIETVEKGEIAFDHCIATPDMMPKMARLGRVLGPRGLMPNPKLGTVTNDVEEAVKKAKAGMVAFKTDKAGVVHGGVGKLENNETALLENVNAFVRAIVDAKPTGAKGTYLKAASLSSTMGPGLRVEPSALLSQAKG